MVNVTLTISNKCETGNQW